MRSIGSTRSVRSKGIRVFVFTLIASLVFVPATASADSAARKVGRGLANLGLGILAIPGEMVKETQESGPARGLTLGFAMGLGMVVVREVLGVYEVLTCPFEVPENFEPIIDPEFPWDYFSGM